MAVDPLTLLKELVAIPSVNPMGRDDFGPEFYETRLTEHLMGFFERLGVEHEQIKVVPGRSNVIARYDNPGATTTILLDAHQDTVPVDGMTIEPFTPVERGGRLYGRGSCDVKGGMAAILAAFSRIVDEKPSGAPNIVVSCTCDEEATVQGVLDLAKLWSDPARSGSLISEPPDLALVAEPTDLDIVVAHRGATRWKLRTRGKAYHSSRPDEGVSAIYRMGRVLCCLEEYAETLAETITPHPLCGPPTFSVGLIQGGISVNTVPDECTIEIDRRVIPGEDGSQVIDQVAEFLRERLGFEVEMLPPWIIGCSLSDHNNGEWADRLLQHIEAVAGPHQKLGAPYGTDAARIAVTGVPAIVFGPGSIAQAHTKDEWIDVDELRVGSEILYRFLGSAG